MKIIKLRIALIMIIFIIITILNGIGTVSLFYELKDSIENILNSNHESIVAVQEMNCVLDDINNQLVQAVLNTGKINQKFDLKKLYENLEKEKKNITEKEEAIVVKDLEDKLEIYKKLLNDFRISSNKKTIYIEEILPIYNSIKLELNSIFSMNQQYLVKMQNKSEEMVQKFYGYSITITISILFIVIIINGYLLNKILTPIEDLIKGIKEVSRGNLKYRLSLKRDKEMNFILKEFNIMVSKLFDYENININKLLQESKKSQSIIESIESPILVTNNKNQVIMLNNSMKKLLDIDRPCLQENFMDIIKFKEICDVIKKSRESINEISYLEELEFKNSHHYKVIANSIWFNGCQNIGTVILMHDITKFKELDKMKTDLLNTISHEFRTPLTSISMAVDILMSNKNTYDEELLFIIKNEGENLNNLVEELLFLSKLENKKILMNIQDTSLKEIEIDILKKFKLQIKEKNINFIINFKDEFIPCDKEKFKWVLNNLISNALRYVDMHGTIELSCIIDEKIRITVADDGIGITEEDLPFIFSKFFQTGENEGSAGLGLAICKEIIDEHNGMISVQSQINKGTIFTILLDK
ncbi:MAG: ATP-binding protein [Clostridium sp.]|uniref:ATP-binding protein n=1 Tax=Clostridium sp. TaxID=1506 RepID=UPI003F2FB4DC